MKLTANVIGATGLTGKHLVQLLLKNENFEKIRIFVRRNNGLMHPKLEEHVVDFGDTGSWENRLTGDVLFSALGTTLKQAGSKEKQYEVDFTFNLSFARKAKANGIENYVLVSSIGANAKSNIFYTRIKGELDDAVTRLGFKNPVILRPSSLAGERDERRWMEELSLPVVRFVTQFIFKKYRPIQGKTVAQAMINGVLKPNPEKTIWEADEVFKLAEV
ncbi:MAG TPA: NADH-quinone oxidoreductase subunit F [Mariniphaga anaerophila]|uniref:NADH-quinone oxidoreductase subunit F n=1 Tax=Mariniphaga anaerophila TaxID=1484053 RepID=A0A831PLJ9_9BACT|nr:NADH-quinone oxidoreductase subunit F [Mariniphaga anaerophila]